MIRVQRLRTKGWRMPENTVYVGRPTKWGNPWTVKNALDSGLFKPEFCARICVEEYEAWLIENQSIYSEHLGKWFDIEDQRDWIFDNLHILKGKNLACWCRLWYTNGSRVPCHADILLELANENYKTPSNKKDMP